MSKAIRKLTSVVTKSNTTLVFLNDVMVRPAASFGPSETTAGGNALKYYASVRVRVSSDAHSPRVITAKVVKNKFVAPFRSVTFRIDEGSRFDGAGMLIDIGEV